MRAYNFGARGFETTKLFRVIYDNMGSLHIFGPSTQTSGRAKTGKNMSPFSTTSDFDREYIGNGSRYLQAETALSTAISATFNKKFGELQSTNNNG